MEVKCDGVVISGESVTEAWEVDSFTEHVREIWSAPLAMTINHKDQEKNHTKTEPR